MTPEGSLAAECERILGASPDVVEPLVHSVVASVTGGVTRVRAGGRTAVVKVVAPRSADPGDASRRPSSFRWWRREADLLPSPVLDAYREAGIRPPALLAAVARGPEVLALWLEDAGGVAGEAWPKATFGGAARRLGRAQGTLARSRPGHPSLSRSFLRDYLAEKSATVPYALLASDEAWAQQAVASVFPSGLRSALVRLHEERGRLLAWVEAAPRTVAHLDVWPHNLFAVEAGVVLVDWAFAGDGALGEDAGNLVPDAVLDLLHPASILPALDEAVFAGYLAGLRDAGWVGDARWVRLAMCASAVKYDWLAPAMLRRAGEARQVGYGGTQVEDRDRLFAERAAALAFLAARADEARDLAAALGLE